MWTWDAKALRYRDAETGRFMRRTEVLDWAERALTANAVATETLAGLVVGGALSPDLWEKAFRQEIKTAYIQAYITAVGGRERMTRTDWSRVGGMLREQYRHLPAFRDDLPTLTEAQIASRMRMYMRSAREGYERAHAEMAVQAGMTEELWVLGDAEHCEDCVAYAGEGWQPVGTFPTPGEGATICLTNCQCHKAYRDPEKGGTL